MDNADVYQVPIIDAAIGIVYNDTDHVRRSRNMIVP